MTSRNTQQEITGDSKKSCSCRVLPWHFGRHSALVCALRWAFEHWSYAGAEGLMKWLRLDSGAIAANVGYSLCSESLEHDDEMVPDNTASTFIMGSARKFSVALEGGEIPLR